MDLHSESAANRKLDTTLSCLCVFDACEMASERHAQQLAAWLLRHPGAE